MFVVLIRVPGAGLKSRSLEEAFATWDVTETKTSASGSVAAKATGIKGTLTLLRGVLTKEEILRRVDTRKAEIKQTLKLLVHNNKVEMCFMVDCTGSMQPHIDVVKDQIRNIVKDATAVHPNCKFKLSFVRYTDFDMKGRPGGMTSKCDLTA